MNYDAQPLTKFEAETFRATTAMQDRIIKSYELMLDFYGLVLIDKSTGFFFVTIFFYNLIFFAKVKLPEIQ